MLTTRKSSIILFMILPLLLIPSMAIADKEPNNSFKNPELIKNNVILGQVDVGIFEDVDIYQIEKEGHGEIGLTVTLLQTGLIEITIYRDERIRIDDLYFTLQNEGEGKTVELDGGKDNELFFVQIKGRGDYSIVVEYPDEPLVSRGLTLKTIILGAVFILLIISFIAISFFFIKIVQIRYEKSRIRMEETLESPYEKIGRRKKYSSFMDISHDPYRIDELPDKDMMMSTPGLGRSIYE